MHCLYIESHQCIIKKKKAMHFIFTEDLDEPEPAEIPLAEED